MKQCENKNETFRSNTTSCELISSQQKLLLPSNLAYIFFTILKWFEITTVIIFKNSFERCFQIQASFQLNILQTFPRFCNLIRSSIELNVSTHVSRCSCSHKNFQQSKMQSQIFPKNGSYCFIIMEKIQGKFTVTTLKITLVESVFLRF